MQVLAGSARDVGLTSNDTRSGDAAPLARSSPPRRSPGSPGSPRSRCRPDRSRARRPRARATTLPGLAAWRSSGSSARRSIVFVQVVGRAAVGRQRREVLPRGLAHARKRRVLSSEGNTVVVAPSSAPMLAMTWRSIARQAGKPGPEVLDDPADAPLHAVAAQHLEDHVLGAHPCPAAAGQSHSPDLRHREVERLARHRERHLEAARADREHAEPPPAHVWLSEPSSVLPGDAEPLLVDRVAHAVAGGLYQTPKRRHALLEEQVIVGVLEVLLQQVVIDVLRGYLGPHAVEAHRLELEHHQRAGGVLGQRLIDAKADLFPAVHAALREVCSDELLGDVHRAHQSRKVRACGPREATPRKPPCDPAPRTDSAMDALSRSARRLLTPHEPGDRRQGSARRLAGALGIARAKANVGACAGAPARGPRQPGARERRAAADLLGTVGRAPARQGRIDRSRHASGERRKARGRKRERAIGARAANVGRESQRRDAAREKPGGQRPDAAAVRRGGRVVARGRVRRSLDDRRLRAAVGKVDERNVRECLASSAQRAKNGEQRPPCGRPRRHGPSGGGRIPLRTRRLKAPSG